MSKLLLAVFLLGTLAHAAKKDTPPLEMGRVISQNISTQNGGTYAAPIGNGAIAVPIYRVSNVIVVDVGQLRYTLIETRNRHPITLIVNGGMQFYRDKNFFVTMDNGGGKHKFSPIGMVQMPDPQK